MVTNKQNICHSDVMLSVSAASAVFPDDDPDNGTDKVTGFTTELFSVLFSVSLEKNSPRVTLEVFLLSKLTS